MKCLKNVQLNQKEGRKRTVENNNKKTTPDKCESDNKIIDLKPIISMITLNVNVKHSALNKNEMEQDPIVLAPSCPLPAFCPWKNVSQRISLIREVRKCRNKGKQSKETT